MNAPQRHHSPLPDEALPQRSRGRACAHFIARDGRAHLHRLEQSGSAKAVILDGPHSGPEVVFLNTSGGLTGGDHLAFELQVPAGARITATTQTAERLYRSAAGRARIEVSASLGRGARLDWLPQETILFDRCAAARHTVIDMAEGAECLLLEAQVLGRAAMGETLENLWFRDTRRVLRAGRLVHMEALALDGARLGAGPGGLAGARAMASLVLVAQGGEDALGPVRAALAGEGVRAAASAFDGRLAVRLMADDGWPLRQQVLRLLAVLRRGPLPRVWQM